MRREGARYVVTGGFVLAALLGIGATFAILAGRTGATDTYFVTYRNVAGMKFGTAVTYEGYPVGQVTRIEPLHDEETGVGFWVRLEIEAGWPVREGSVARIVSSGLISAATVDIRDGASGRLHPPGAELPGAERTSVFAALSEAANDFRMLSRQSLRPLAQRLASELPALVADVRGLLNTSVRPLADMVRTELDDPRIYREVKEAIAGLNTVTRRVSGLVDADAAGKARTVLDNLAALSDELRESNRRLQSLVDNEARAELHNTLGALRQASAGVSGLSRAAQALVGSENRARVDRILGNVDATAADVRALVQQLGGARSQIARVLSEVEAVVAGSGEDLGVALAELRRTLEILAAHVDSIAYHVEGSSRNLFEFSRLVRENPGVLLRGRAQSETSN